MDIKFPNFIQNPDLFLCYMILTVFIKWKNTIISDKITVSCDSPDNALFISFNKDIIEIKVLNVRSSSCRLTWKTLRKKGNESLSYQYVIERKLMRDPDDRDGFWEYEFQVFHATYRRKKTTLRGEIFVKFNFADERVQNGRISRMSNFQTKIDPLTLISRTF